MKESLKDQNVIRRVLDPPVSSLATDDNDRPLSAVVLLMAGCVLGLLIMFAAQRCNREPMPAVTHSINDIRCTVCHFDRMPILDTGKKYRAYHQRKTSRKVFYDKEEQEYLANLIAGGKP